MLLIRRLLSALCLLVVASAGAANVEIPEEFMKGAKAIREEKSRERRLSLVMDLQAAAKRRVREIPEEIPESELPKTELLYELDLYFGILKRENLNPANCPKVQQAMQGWSNPTGEGEESSTGRFVREVVQAVRRE